MSTEGSELWSVVGDSSCDLMELETDENVSFSTVPFLADFDGVGFVDDETMDIDALLDAIDHSPKAGQTACPSPSTWLKKFEEATCSLAVTISSNLSGSYNAAMAAKRMMLEKFPEKKVEVIDSLGTGPTEVLVIDRILKSIRAGMDFDAVVEAAKKQVKDTHIIFALCSYSNLIKNGRMKPVVGLVAKALRIWGVGIGSPEGTIVIKDKTRGENNVIRIILNDIKARRTIDNEIVISHCRNVQLAEKLKEAILEEFRGARVRILQTRGLDSFYAERGGIIVSY